VVEHVFEVRLQISPLYKRNLPWKIWPRLSLGSKMRLKKIEAERIRVMGANFSPAILAETRKLFANAVSVRADCIRAANVAYGRHDRQLLDVYGLGRGVADVVLYVPGGGFVGGEKDDGRAFYRNVGTFFAEKGYVCVIPNYRLAPEFNWPAGGEDVKTAIDWCRENIAHYGGEPDRIHVIGQSAGATHVATALFHRDLAIDGQLASATLINGVFDATDIPPAENLVAYFGPDDEGRRQRSPLAHVRKTSLPIMIGVTEYDPAFLAYPSYRLADALTKANGKSPTFLWLAGHNHVSCIFAIGSSSDDLGPELVNFLCNVTRTAGEPEGATA
jgi:acetyl esterase/lipase